MLTTHATTIATERNIAARAMELFVTSYGLTWSDSYAAAAYERAEGAPRLSRALTLVASSGCTFAEAVAAVEASDTFLLAA